jgi:CheY-like chemotaxis protein
MATQEADLDLDFTKVFRVPASLRPEPPAPAPAPAPTPAAVAASPPNLVCFARTGSARAVPVDAPVLVVEDHEPSRRMMGALLQRQGFPVRLAADSRECARELRKPPLPRLILLDVGLPRINGFQILSHLRQHPQTAAIPVVMVTASAGDKDLMRGLTLGAEGYLAKPVNVKALQSILEVVLWKR